MHYNLIDIEQKFVNFKIEFSSYHYNNNKYRNLLYKIELWFNDCTKRFFFRIYTRIHILTKRFYQEKIFKANPVEALKLFVILKKRSPI